MSKENSKKIIENFYSCFNNSNFETLFSLFDEGFVHEVNYVKTTGREKFKEFLLKNRDHYKEKIPDYYLMMSDDGRYVTTSFTVKGEYYHTDDPLLPATNQHYELPVINYFEIQNGKIVKGACWFSEEEFVKQISR